MREPRVIKTAANLSPEEREELRLAVKGATFGSCTYGESFTALGRMPSWGNPPEVDTNNLSFRYDPDYKGDRKPTWTC